uniref:serine C-palmitoyltransferase n=1 Tax=Corethron hystrix TaxID=216773 RepID=A0A7S1G2Z8_9STRA|mmetsp:Transcript_959/g.1887  ORF Transcript_959/g.1887 Transcript_959/m.1887 type:complete len:549 (+) Transcript_959:2-1648(+)
MIGRFLAFENKPVATAVQATLLIFLMAAVVGIRTTGRKRSRKIKSSKQASSSPSDFQEGPALTPEEEEDIIAKWVSKPLVPKKTAKATTTSPTGNVVIHSIVRGTAYVMADILEGTPTPASNSPPKKILNMASFDFLGVGTGSCHRPDEDDSSATSSDPVQTAARSALRTYGVGSCGPRGFYGTVGPAHLALESAMASACAVDTSILYSDACAASTSAVAAFCKRGDVIVVDEAVCQPLADGVRLSRSYVRTFRHNDMEDLERVLKEIKEDDERNGRKQEERRRFIVAEAVYRSTGRLLPLKKLVELKGPYGYRLILDEAASFGVLGDNGGGLTESCGLGYCAPDVEIAIISLEHAMSTIGGMVVGDTDVIDHQRLSGAGYCFSASNPPFFAFVGQASLGMLRGDDGRRAREKLRHNMKVTADSIEKHLKDTAKIVSDIGSPLVFVMLEDCSIDKIARDGANMMQVQTNFWRQVARTVLVKDNILMVAVAGNNAKPPSKFSRSMPSCPTFPSIRMTITASQTEEDICRAVLALKETVKEILTSGLEMQ